MQAARMMGKVIGRKVVAKRAKRNKFCLFKMSRRDEASSKWTFMRSNRYSFTCHMYIQKRPFFNITADQKTKIISIRNVCIILGIQLFFRQLRVDLSNLKHAAYL